MKSVYKYPLPISDMVDLYLPAGAQILTLQVQRGNTCLWCLVETDNLAFEQPRRFRWFGTGHAIEDAERLTYVGTVLSPCESLVFHLFEVTDDPS
jgi:hypothetical protein